MTLRAWRKGRALRLGLFAFLVAAGGAGTARAAEEFCVQTFNVYGPAYASHVSWRLGMAGRALRAEGCEAVQLQELWRESQFRQLEEALAPARLAGLWADHVRGDRGLTGLGSFFAGTVRRARAELYRNNNGAGLLDRVRERTGVRKGFTIFDVQLDGRPPLRFVNTHLHPSDSAIRVAQLLELSRTLYADPESARAPLLFTGDLNAEPTSLEYALLRDLLLLSDAYADRHGGYGAECTYCRKNVYSWLNRDLVMDYVLFRGSTKVALGVRAAEINLRGAGHPWSDHYGVRADFEWSEGAEELLPREDPRVSARIAAAATTLAHAGKLLAGAEGEGLPELRRYVASLEEELARGALPAELELTFRARAGARNPAVIRSASIRPSTY